MDLEQFVLESENLNVSFLKKRLSEFSNVAALVFYSALKDDISLANFVTDLHSHVDIPYSGLKVTGFFCNKKYYSDAIGVMVLCGDLKVSTQRVNINYSDFDSCSDQICNQLVECDLCLVWSASTYYDNPYIDAILRRVSEKKSKTCLVGGISAPDPLVFSDLGVYNDSISLMTVFPILGY